MFERDRQRLLQEIASFPDDDSLWAIAPGVSNRAGNLILHLEGNLREYIGRQLGGVPYSRDRRAEFGGRDLTREDLTKRVESLKTIPHVIANLSENVLETAFPENVFGRPWTTRQFLIHLHGHFNYHLGQIDYLRRVLTQSGAVGLVQL